MTLLTFFIVNGWSAQTLKVLEKESYIYSTESGEEKIAVMTKGEVVHLLQKGVSRSKIKADGEYVGWAMNTQLEYIVAENKGERYDLKEIDITGWLDNPSAIYILDASTEENSLVLTRNFSHEIFEFVDREEIERRNDEN